MVAVMAQGLYLGLIAAGLASSQTAAQERSLPSYVWLTALHPVVRIAMAPVGGMARLWRKSFVSLIPGRLSN